MAVEIWDIHGKNIEDTGMPGELVCTRPHPSMPVFFWGDQDNEKYRKAYFDTYPGMSCVAFHVECRSLTKTDIKALGDKVISS